MIILLILFVLISSSSTNSSSTETDSNNFNNSTSVTPLMNSTDASAHREDPIDKHSGHLCTYKNPQYCDRHIKNIFALYTGWGGWILLAVIVGGIVFQIHFLLSGRNVMYLQFKRRDLKHQLKMSKRNRLMSKWTAEIEEGLKK